MAAQQQSVLKQVDAFAAQAHNGQKRKYAPEQYINHPRRVMCMLEKYTTDEATLAAALLHDVLEDTEITRARLNEFLFSIMDPEKASKTASLVDELTDVFTKQRYPAWNRRKRRQAELKRLEKTSPESQTIKYADIIDNCSQIVEADPDFAGTFLNECFTLLKKTSSGERALYRRALSMVEDGLRKLKRSSL